MDFEASFEAKLQEHLRAVAAAANDAKEHIRLGVGAQRSQPQERRAEPEWAPPPRPQAAVSFDDLSDTAVPRPEVDDEGIPVWEDPP